MATPVRATRMSVSISGPAYMVAVGGAPRASKAKTSVREETRILPRYLRPPTGSCHDFCKHGVKDESELKKPTRKSGSRKKPVGKSKGVTRTVVPVERKKMTKTKPEPSNPKSCARSEPVKLIKIEKSLPSKHSLTRKGNGTQNERKKSRPTTGGLNGQKNKIGIKSLKDMVPKSTSPVKDQNMMTKTMIKQLIAEKVQEMALHEIISPPTNLLNLEEVQSSSNTHVSNSEPEHADDEEVVLEEACEYTNGIFEDGYEMETPDGKRYRVVICEDEDEDSDVKFKRGRILELESDNDPAKLKFRRGRILDHDGDGESENVTLKHQEVQQKEVQELLNSVIEETASKLVEDMKTKVGALVGAFETVISRHDEIQPSSTES